MTDFKHSHKFSLCELVRKFFLVSFAGSPATANFQEFKMNSVEKTT